MATELVTAERAPWAHEGVAGDAGAVLIEISVFSEALRLIRRHRLTFVLVALAVSGCGVVAALVLPSQYATFSTVLIETNFAETVTLKEALSDTPADAEAIATELELFDSRELLEKACDQLGLINDPEFNPLLRPGLIRPFLVALLGRHAGWLAGRTATSAANPLRPIDDVVAAFRRKLSIAQIGRARAIRISFTATNPMVAAAAVNTLAELYTEEHKDLREETTQEANSWISERITRLKQRADVSAAAVEEYRVAHNLTRGRDALLVQQQVTEVSSQLTAARQKHSETQAALAGAQHALVSGQSAGLAAVLNSTLVERLREQEAQLTAQHADDVTRRGAAHPASVTVTAQLDDVRGQLVAETGRVLQSLRGADNVAAADETALETRMTAARIAVEDADTLDVGLQERRREADTDDTFYRTFLTRSKETDPQFNFPRVNVRVLSWAVPPAHPASPNRPLIMAAGVALSLVAGFAAVFARGLLLRGLRSRDDVDALCDAPSLGIIPLLPRIDRPGQQARLQDAVILLWARLLGAPGAERPGSLVVTSAVPREGKTTFTRMLGVVASERGQRVLIVDGDLRCASLTASLPDGTTRRGLADIIRGEATLDEVVVSEAPNLDILTAGQRDRSPVRLLTSPAFAELLRTAERQYDLVLVDAPPMLIGADAWLLACSARSVVMLARWGHTRPSAISAALRQLADGRVPCAGIILSLVDIGKHARYDEASSLSRSRRARRYYAAVDVLHPALQNRR